MKPPLEPSFSSPFACQTPQDDFLFPFSYTCLTRLTPNQTAAPSCVDPNRLCVDDPFFVLLGSLVLPYSASSSALLMDVTLI